MILNRKLTTSLLIVFLLTFFAIPASSHKENEENRPNQAIDLVGTKDGADYKIRVPEDWNGILIVYAHGYSTSIPAASAAPGGTAMEDFLLTLGYAVAGSSYKAGGWAVKEGLKDTAKLTKIFKSKVGKPDQVILWGFSMGSVIAFESAEKHSNYDGIIAGCAVGAGAPRAWDGALQIGNAYDATFGWPDSWGSVGDVRDNLDFNSDVVPTLVGQVSDPSNFGLFEFIRLVNDLPAEDFYSGSNWLFTDMFFVTQARAELETRAKGPVAQNVGITASLSSAEISYLNSLGVDAADLLDEMNSNNYKASKKGRKYVNKYADYNGKIKVPVLTLHTTTDGLVPVSNENAYRQTIEDAGRSSMLVQTYTDSVGHCTFSPQQLVSVIYAMQSWLETGNAPSSAFFPEALGFLNDFTPPEFPF